MRKTLVTDYTSGPITKQLITFALPFVFSNLLQTAYNIVDMMIVGRMIGSVGMSAVSIGSDILHMYLFLALGLSNAGQIIISQYIGARDRNAIPRILGSMTAVILGISLLAAVFGPFLCDFWFTLLHVPSEAIEYCRAYTICCTCGLPFLFGYIMISAMLRGMGDSKRPFLFVAIASLVNIFLDYLFISRGMGTYGAALATVIAQGISFVCSVAYLIFRRGSLGFAISLRALRPDKVNLSLLLRIGIPLVIQDCAISISSLYVSSQINRFGVVVSAVTGVGLKINSVAGIIASALCNAGATIIAQNYAAHEFGRIRKTYLSSMAIGFLFSAAFSVVIIFFPEQVFSLFNSEAGVLSLCHAYVPIAVIHFLSWAFRAPSMALCNGMGFPRLNFLIGLLDGFVMRIGLCWLLGSVLQLGITGYWLGSALAGYAYFIAMFPYFLSGRWKKRAPPVAGAVASAAEP